MRQVLLDASATLSRPAAEHLEVLVAQATTDPDGTVVRQTRTGCEWWTYAGLKANAVLVQRRGLPATFDSLTIRARCSPIELKQALDAPAKDLAPQINERFLPNFAECLPDHLIVRFAGERLYDRDGASQIEQAPILERL
jgi:hypothetical protein